MKKLKKGTKRITYGRTTRMSTKQRKFQHSGITRSRERNLCRVKIFIVEVSTRETKKKGQNRIRNTKKKTGITKENYFYLVV